MLESVASEIVNMEPGVKGLFLRSDNAGCYHNAALLSGAAVIIARQGLVLRDYSFSEANRQGCVRPKDRTTQGTR